MVGRGRKESVKNKGCIAWQRVIGCLGSLGTNWSSTTTALDSGKWFDAEVREGEHTFMAAWFMG